VSSQKDLIKARQALPPLPDVSKWIPHAPVSSQSLQEASTNAAASPSFRFFSARQMANERKMNIHNFDAGSGIEDIVRDELRAILPLRYGVRAGTINDRGGKTAGDFEVVISNDDWFPAVKAGATLSSRRVHLPIEAVYSVIEVKQTLIPATLDSAMQKLVLVHRLHRPLAGTSRITVNRRLKGHSSMPSNLLYSAIVATGIGDTPFPVLIERFLTLASC
jgi:hypothetical protein